MEHFQGLCNQMFCGEQRDNRPAYADGTFWTMLVAAIVGLVLSSIVAIPTKLTKFEQKAGALINKEFFFLPIPEWVLPFLFLAIHVTLFLGVYLSFRKVNVADNISSDRRRQAKSYIWLLYLLIIAFKFLWSWCYFSAGEATIALLFAGCLVAAVTLLLILTGNKEWGGEVRGSWFLIWPTAIYLLLVAAPLNFSTVFMSNSKNSSKNRSLRKTSNLLSSLSP